MIMTFVWYVPMLTTIYIKGRRYTSMNVTKGIMLCHDIVVYSSMIS